MISPRANKAQVKSEYYCHLSPKAMKETALVGAKVGGFLLTVFSVPNYIILDIYKVSLDDSFTLSGGHSCRGLRGLGVDQISSHQLRNGVQIAALIPKPGPVGGSSALKQPISIHLQQMRPLIDLQLTVASPLCVQHTLRTYRHFSTLYI